MLLMLQGDKRTYSTLTEIDQMHMFEQNGIKRGGPLMMSLDPSKLYEGYDILDSFHEQHLIDLEFTVLTVYLFHIVLIC